jgi:hypothetical protein
MTDTATQKGVDEAEVVVVGNIERNETIERIAKASREARDKELAEAGHEVIDTSGEEKEEEPKETEQAAEQAEEQPKQDKEESEPAPAVEKMVRVKVDGVEKEVPESLIHDAGIRAIQKESAADSRLAEATRLLKEAQQVKETKKTSLPEMDVMQLLNRVRQGTDEDANEAASLLMGREQATPEDIESAVEQRVLRKIEMNQAGQWFIEEYKDIAADPYLGSLAISEELRLRESGDTRPYKEILKEVGDGINKKLNEWRGGKATISTSTDKKERKADISNLPTASARKAAPEQPQPKTPSQIIDEMRKARGQAV